MNSRLTPFFRMRHVKQPLSFLRLRRRFVLEGMGVEGSWLIGVGLVCCCMERGAGIKIVLALVLPLSKVGGGVKSESIVMNGSVKSEGIVMDGDRSTGIGTA